MCKRPRENPVIPQCHGENSITAKHDIPAELYSIASIIKVKMLQGILQKPRNTTIDNYAKDGGQEEPDPDVVFSVLP